MKKVNEMNQALIKIDTEIHVNGDHYAGYVTAISADEITIKNYDLELEVIKISDIKRLKNRDESIIFLSAE